MPSKRERYTIELTFTLRPDFDPDRMSEREVEALRALLPEILKEIVQETRVKIGKE